MVALTREELFELVWAKPSTQLARELGVSDVAIAKTCKRYEIPKPPLGYWAKVKNGQKLKRPPLKPLTKGRTTPITFQTHSVSKPQLAPETKEKIQRENEAESQVIVSDTLRSPHHLVKKTSDAFQTKYCDEYGRARPTGDGCIDLNVAVASISRALRIWDALLKALEKRGHSVEVKHEYTFYRSCKTWCTYAVVHGEAIQIRMEEPSKRFDRVPTEKEKKWGYWKQWDYSPSGKLNLIVETYCGDGHQKVWTDGSKTPVEKKLNQFISALLLASDARKARRLEEEKQAKDRLERETRRREEEDRQKLEKAKVDDLNARVSQWKYHRIAREFLDAVETAAFARGDLPANNSGLLRWLDWAKRSLEKNDPILTAIRDHLDN